jgi:hypothetical protein
MSKELAEKLAKALPLLDGLETGQECEEYAFAKGTGFQAMTYCPQAFEALRCIPEVLAALNRPAPPEMVEYEVWQEEAYGEGEAMVAGSTNLADAQHYASVYGQDGRPAWVVEVVRRRLSAPPEIDIGSDTVG